MKTTLLIAVLTLFGCGNGDSEGVSGGLGSGSVPEQREEHADSETFDAGESGGSTVFDAGVMQRAGALPSCPRFGAGVSAGRIASSAITEASGIAASRRNAGTLWIHNDSGAGPRVYAVSKTGTLQAIYDLGGAAARDWEDLAVGPGPVVGKSYLYVGDIGDNAESRAGIEVYRVPEPDVRTASPSTPITLSAVERLSLLYPDRAHNAETLLVDPISGDVYIVAKSSDGISPVFRAAAPLSATGTNRLERVAILRFGVAPLAGSRTTTGGDISPSGSEIVIRSYDAAYLWRRALGMSVGAALATTPCPIPLVSEPQGEAIGFFSDGNGYYTVSEGVSQPIYSFSRR